MDHTTYDILRIGTSRSRGFPAKANMHSMLDELIGVSGAMVTAASMTPDSTELSTAKSSSVTIMMWCSWILVDVNA